MFCRLHWNLSIGTVKDAVMAHHMSGKFIGMSRIPSSFIFHRTISLSLSFLNFDIVYQCSQWLLWHTIGPLQGSSGWLLYSREFTNYILDFFAAQQLLFTNLSFLGNGYAWSQPLGRVEFNGAGVSIFHSLFMLLLFCPSCFSLQAKWFNILNRMSANMAACIAVESISILEKLHSKGWAEIIYIQPNIFRYITVDLC